MCKCLNKEDTPQQNFGLHRADFCELLQKLRLGVTNPLSNKLIRFKTDPQIQSQSFFESCQFYLTQDYGLSKTDAYDRMTDSFLILLDILKAGNICYGRLQGLLRWIAGCQTINFLNRRKRTPNVVGDFTDIIQSEQLSMQDIEAFKKAADETLQKYSSQQVLSLDAALEKLKKEHLNYYKVLNLYYYELLEMPETGRHKAIADNLNITTDMSMAHLARGKKKIRDYINNHQNKFL